MNLKLGNFILPRKDFVLVSSYYIRKLEKRNTYIAQEEPKTGAERPRRQLGAGPLC